MTNYQWRLLGEETLACTVDREEVGLLLGDGFAFSADEALVILDEDGLVMVVESGNQADGFEWIRGALASGEEFRLVMIAAGPAEVVRHMCLTDSEGIEFRGAVKLRFQAIPARAADFFLLSGGSPLVSTAEVEALLGGEVEAPIARELRGIQVADLRDNPEKLEELRSEATSMVRELAARAGIKVTGLGLAWGFDAERVERMAAAAGRHAESLTALAAQRESVLRERELRLEALKAARLAESSVSIGIEPEQPEESISADEEERFARIDSFIEEELQTGVGGRDELSAPCGDSQEEGGLSACLFQPPKDEDEESVELPPAEGDLEEPEPVTGEGAEPAAEPGPEDFAFAGNAEELTEPLPAVSGFVDGDEPGNDAEPLKGEFTEPQPDESSEDSAVSCVPDEVEEEAPFVSMAEKVKHAPGWKLYGEQTLACVVDEVEIPRLFRKDFELGEDEAIIVLRGSRCEDFIVKGIERTSGALTWISKLHTGGKELGVLWSRTSEFTIELDVAGTDGEAEDIYGVVKILARVPALSAPGLLKLMGERRSLGYPDIIDHLCLKATGVFHESLVGEAVSRSGHALLEHALKSGVQREAQAAGIEILELGFDWARDADSCARVDWGYRKRCLAHWRFSIERNLLDARRKIELLARKIENISAYLHLSEQAKPDLRKMLIRSAFGVQALKGAPPKQGEAELELGRARGEIAELKDGLSMLVETGDLELRRGPPRLESRSAAKFVSEEEEGFLADSFEGDGWEGDVTIGGQAGPGLMPQLGSRREGEPCTPAAENGARGGNGESHILNVGGLGPKHTVQTRCVHCMAPLRRDLSTCGNCGRRV